MAEPTVRVAREQLSTSPKNPDIKRRTNFRTPLPGIMSGDYGLDSFIGHRLAL